MSEETKKPVALKPEYKSPFHQFIKEIPSEEEMKFYNELSSEEERAIIKTGIDTVFWKWLKVQLVNTLHQADSHLKRRRVSSLDVAIDLTVWNALWKNTEEILNAPKYKLMYLEKLNATKKK